MKIKLTSVQVDEQEKAPHFFSEVLGGTQLNRRFRSWDAVGKSLNL
jgi:hypothetical protein